MNIHPIFVHFPIALLTIYSLLEILRFKQLNTKTFFYIKSTFLILGSLAILAAYLTGDYGIPLHRDVRAIIAMHELYAKITMVIFALLAGNYVLILLEEYSQNRRLPVQATLDLLEKIRAKIFSAPVVVALAVLGLIALTITGSLGGYIAYGPGNDFITDSIAKLIIR